MKKSADIENPVIVKITGFLVSFLVITTEVSYNIHRDVAFFENHSYTQVEKPMEVNKMENKKLTEQELDQVTGGGIPETDGTNIDILIQLEMEKRRALEEALKAQGYSDSEIAEMIKAMDNKGLILDNDPRNGVIPIIF